VNSLREIRIWEGGCLENWLVEEAVQTIIEGCGTNTMLAKQYLFVSANLALFRDSK
jgi:hypothetical protein